MRISASDTVPETETEAKRRKEAACEAGGLGSVHRNLLPMQ